MSSSRPVAEIPRANFRSARMPIIAALSVQRDFSARRSAKPFCLHSQRQFVAQGAVASDAAGRRDAPDAVPFGRANGFGNQHFDDGGLHAGAQVADFLRIIQQRRIVAQKIADGSFQPAETEIVARVVKQRAREIERLGIPLLRQPVNFRPGGIGRPISLPVLSKHSPAASSTVEPSTRCCNSLSTSTSIVCPPLTMSETFG